MVLWNLKQQKTKHKKKKRGLLPILTIKYAQISSKKNNPTSMPESQKQLLEDMLSSSHYFDMLDLYLGCLLTLLM